MRDDWDPKPGTRVIIDFAPGCLEEFKCHGTAKIVKGRTGVLKPWVDPYPKIADHTLVVVLDEPIEYSTGQFQHFQYFAFHELQPVELS